MVIGFMLFAIAIPVLLGIDPASLVHPGSQGAPVGFGNGVQTFDMRTN